METWVVSHLVASVDGLAVDNNGRLYFSCDGYFWGKQDDGSIKSLYREITDITGMVWDGNRTVYTCNVVSHAVEQYDTETKTTTSVLENATPLNSPRAITSKNGIILLTEDHCIWSIDPRNKTQSHLKFAGSLISPNGIAVSDSGTIFVLDQASQFLHKITDGQIWTITTIDPPRKFAGRIFPRGILVEDEEHVLVVSYKALLRVNVKEKTKKSLLPLQYGSALTKDTKGNLYIGTNYGVLMLRPLWTNRRLLWIAHLKEDARYCDLAKLPKEIIRHIASYVCWVVPPVPEKPKKPVPPPEPTSTSETDSKADEINKTQDKTMEVKKEENIVVPEQAKEDVVVHPPSQQKSTKPVQHKCIIQ